MPSIPKKPVRYRHFTIEQYEAKALARFWAKVNKTETCWLWTARESANGYGTHTLREYPEGRLKAGVKSRDVRAHRYSWELENGPIPEGMEIDHVCHTRLCVRPAHLRIATRKQNGENRQGATVLSTSGIRGVSWITAKSRWRAVVGHNGKNVHVGYYRELADAEAAVIAKRNELHTHNDLDRLA
jgi:hypothetical protein